MANAGSTMALWSLYKGAGRGLQAGENTYRAAGDRRLALRCRRGAAVVRILGIVAETHDSGVALLQDGAPAFVFEEERFNRCKRTKKFPKLSLAALAEELRLDA